MEYKKKVILLKGVEDPLWALLSFETDFGTNVVESWDAEKTFEAEIAFNELVKNARKTKDHFQWTSWRHPMRGEAGKLGLVELGFKASGRQYRVLSIFDGTKRLVMLSVCYHKGKIWTPKEAVETAMKRAKQVLAKKAKLNVIQIPDRI